MPRRQALVKTRANMYTQTNQQARERKRPSHEEQNDRFRVVRRALSQIYVDLSVSPAKAEARCNLRKDRKNVLELARR